MASVVANGVRFNVQRLGSAGPAGTVVCLHGLLLDNLSLAAGTVSNDGTRTQSLSLVDAATHATVQRIDYTSPEALFIILR